MVEYARTLISTIEMVVRVEQIDMRRQQFAFEDALKSVFAGPSKSLDNIPHPPGPTPRWMLADGEKLLIANDQTLNLTLNFQGSRPQSGIIAVAEKYGRALDIAIDSIVSRDKVIFAGVVASINCSSATSDIEISQEITRLMINTKMPLERVITASVGIGYVGIGAFESFNFYYQVSPYRSLNIPVPTRQSAMSTIQTIDADSIAPSEVGLLIRIDVNDRKLNGQQFYPSRKEQIHKGMLVPLVPACREACTVGLREILGKPEIEVEGL